MRPRGGAVAGAALDPPPAPSEAYAALLEGVPDLKAATQLPEVASGENALLLVADRVREDPCTHGPGALPPDVPLQVAGPLSLHAATTRALFEQQHEAMRMNSVHEEVVYRLSHSGSYDTSFAVLDARRAEAPGGRVVALSLTLGKEGFEDLCRRIGGQARPLGELAPTADARTRLVKSYKLHSGHVEVKDVDEAVATFVACKVL